MSDDCATASVALMTREDADALAAGFALLGDPVRVRLFDYIARAEQGTVCACELPDALGISQPTMSHHLRRLVRGGLLTREQRGRWAHYCVREGALTTVLAFLAQHAKG